MANRGNHHQKNSQKDLCSKHYKKILNNTWNTNGGTDGQTLGRLKRIIIVALKTCKPKCVSPILESVSVWKSIPEFLTSNMEALKKGYAYHLSYLRLQWGFICTFSDDVKWETSPPLSGLRCEITERKPPVILYSSQTEGSSAWLSSKVRTSYRLRPICKTKGTQDFVTFKY